MEQLILWQPEFAKTEKGVLLTCFVSSSTVMEPGFDNNEIVHEIYNVLQITGDPPFAVKWNCYFSIYTVYPDDYEDLYEAWTEVWRLEITIQADEDYKTIKEENIFLMAGGDYPSGKQGDNPQKIFIVDFASKDDYTECLQKLNDLSIKELAARSIRNDQLYQAFLVGDEKDISKEKFDEVVEIISDCNGYYNYVLRTDEFGEKYVEDGISVD